MSIFGWLGESDGESGGDFGGDFDLNWAFLKSSQKKRPAALTSASMFRQTFVAALLVIMNITGTVLCLQHGVSAS